MGKLECTYITGENIKWCIYFGKQFGNVLKSKTKNLPYDREIAIYPREKNNICSHEDWH